MKKITYKNGDSQYFIVMLYEQNFTLKSKNNIISIKTSHSNYCCLYSLKIKNLVCINDVLSLFLMLLFLSILTLKTSYIMFCICFNINNFFSD